MPTLSTPVIAVGTAPTVISTFFTHFLARRKRHAVQRKQAKEAARFKAANDGSDGLIDNGQTGEEEWENPDREFSYDEGLQIVKKFLAVASTHSVEELQAFTAAHVPVPHWVHLSHVPIPSTNIDKATSILLDHFRTVYGEEGLAEIGGANWWKIRGKDLEGEWIEMRKAYLKRTLSKVDRATSEGDGQDHDAKKDRVILYIHGGAYFFSSIDTHRYQIQRHARKLGGRAFSPSYRLAPQYPFPCGLHDALATYLFLIDPPAGSSHEPIPPSSIIVSGDSAGAGLVLSLLVLIRDSGGRVPMPAGACLISPWVDLTHSFKSVSGEDKADYIPSQGFHYKPSPAWPPLKGDGIEVDVRDPETGRGEKKLIDDQIQMYTSNRLITHPLVSPVCQGSLGGLCPLMIMGGSGELLRDEMIYLAHKAAAPSSYPPAQHVLDRYPQQKDMIGRFPPTKVHLQMYDGCAHVTPTLSFTKPAKWMYRACANFNIWAITAAQLAEERAARHKSGQPHQHHHSHRPHKQGSTSTAGTIPSRSSTLDSSYASSPTAMTSTTTPESGLPSSTQPSHALSIDSRIHKLANEADNVSDAGSECSSDSDFDGEPSDFPMHELVTVTGAEPPFVDSMIRERVSVRGRIRPFEPVSECDTFADLDLQGVGRVHGDGPIVKWLAARAAWDKKYSSALEKNRVMKQIDLAEASKTGYLTRDLTSPQDRPPLCSLAVWHSQEQARAVGKSVDEVGRRGKSVGGAVGMWMRMGEKEDQLRQEDPEIHELEKQLSDKGISDKTMDVLGDKKIDGPRGVKEHLAEDGLAIAPVPTSIQGGNEGKSLPEITERPKDLAAGSESPSARKILLGKVVD